MILTVHLLSEANVISVLNKKPKPLVTYNRSVSFLRNTLMMCLLSSLSKEKIAVDSVIVGL
jgi:hypothetical protein